VTVAQHLHVQEGPEVPHVRVLVVDDTPALRVLTRAVLEGTGFEVVGEAGDGLAGVTLAAELRPDLVLLDLAMPVMDGLEALRLIRARSPRSAVVMLSCFSRYSLQAAQARSLGAHGFICKGLPRAQLLAKLETILRGHAVGSPA